MLARNPKIVPAPMFHSVGLESWPWVWAHISEPVDTFEGKIRLLKEYGFEGVFWSELYEHMSGNRVLPDNSILLTFDDGYLDNWVYAYPILKKYGMRATIFVTPDFVDPGEGLRPNLEDVVSNRIDGGELTVAGFLSWAEMREMERSGVVDIQSHALTHTWYFTGPRVIDYHRPHEIPQYPWLLWNMKPDRKPYYLNEDQQRYLPWGYPILEHEKSLAARRFFPEDGAIQTIVNRVAHGREEAGFFDQPTWRAVLDDFVRRAFDNGEIPGSYESDEARRERITEELQSSKILIEKNLSKKVDFICWPGGANSDEVQEIARAVGYKSWTLNSGSELQKRNSPGADPTSIKRIRSSNRVEVRGRNCGMGGARFFLWRLMEHQNSTVHRFGIRGYQLASLLRSRGGSS